MIISDSGYVKLKGKKHEQLADLDNAIHEVYVGLVKKYGKEFADKLIKDCFNSAVYGIEPEKERLFRGGIWQI